MLHCRLVGPEHVAQLGSQGRQLVPFEYSVEKQFVTHEVGGSRTKGLLQDPHSVFRGPVQEPQEGSQGFNYGENEE